MARSVVLAGAARCPRCSQPPRWCVCDMIPPVETPLQVHVLIHRGERHKPSSTGTLVARTVTTARCHTYQRETRFFAASGFASDSLGSGEELWVLHPCGDPPPPAAPGGAHRPHVLLLDGTWRQSGEMLRAVEGMGRRVRLPEPVAEPSRYWLRNQPAATHLSTAEALIGVFEAVGEITAARRLRLHFELHVYATLRARGKREMAERYLGHSPLLAEVPEAVARLQAGQIRLAEAVTACRDGEPLRPR
jgi:DTW domain-containing protein